MEGALEAIKIIGFLLIAMIPPLAFMMLNGHFVGKRAAPQWLCGLVVFGAFCLIAPPLFNFCLALLRKGETLGFIHAALVAGAGIAAIVAMQEVKRYEGGATASSDTHSSSRPD